LDRRQIWKTQVSIWPKTVLVATFMFAEKSSKGKKTRVEKERRISGKYLWREC